MLYNVNRKLENQQRVALSPAMCPAMCPFSKMVYMKIRRPFQTPAKNENVS